MTIKNILFPTDFSECSGNALYYATHLASKLKADLVLMHSYEFPDEYSAIPAPQIISMKDSLKKEAETQIKGLIRDVSEISPATNFSYDIELGFFTEYLEKVIHKRKIDLVAIGTKGAEGIDTIFGTTTGQVLYISSCPVLVIPEEAAYSPVKKIMYLSQYKESDIPRLKYLVEIAKVYDATIFIVNVSGNGEVQPDNNYIELVSEEIDYPLISFKCLEGDDVIQCVTEFSEKENMNWIAMYMSPRSSFAEIFRKNLTKEMSYRTQIPLLAFHDNGEKD